MSRNAISVLSILVVGGFVVAIVRAQDSSRSPGGSYTNANRPFSAALAQNDSRPERSVLTTRTADRPSSVVGDAGSQGTNGSLRIAERLQRARRSATGDAAISDSATGESGGSQSSVTRRPLGTAGSGWSSSGLTDSSIGAGSAERGGASTSGSTEGTSELADDPHYSSARRIQHAPSSPPPDEFPVGGPTTSERAAASNELALSSVGPALRMDTVGPRSILIGKPATYTLTLVNEGRTTANDVYVRVAVPGWIEISSTQATAGSAQTQEDSAAEQRLIWTVSRLAAGEQESLQLNFVALENRAFDLAVDWTVRPPSSIAQIEVQQPQLQMSVFGPKDILYGETAVYTIQLTNPGTGVADDVAVEFAYGGQRLPKRSVGSIAAGQQMEISVELTARQAGNLPVAAVATATGGLRAEASEDVLVRRAELAVEVTGSPRQFAGSVGTYQIRLTNTGNAMAADVVAKAVLPTGAVYVAGGDFAPGDAGLANRIGPLAPGAERVLHLQCQLLTPGENNVQVTVQDADNLSSLGNFVTRVEALADLKMEISDPKGPTAVGSEAQYEITIVNRGTKAAEGVNVVAQFSTGVEPIKARGASAELVPGQVLFQTIPKIAAGETLSLKVVAVADAEGNHRFRAELTADDPETKLIAEETTYYFGSATR